MDKRNKSLNAPKTSTMANSSNKCGFCVTLQTPPALSHIWDLGGSEFSTRDPHGVNPARPFLTCLLPRRYGRRPFPPRRGRSSALPAAMSRRGAIKGWLISPTVSPTTPRVAPLAPALKQREMLPNGAWKRLLPAHPHTAAGSSPSARARCRHPPFPSPRPHSAMAPAGPGASQAELRRSPPPENGR